LAARPLTRGWGGPPAYPASSTARCRADELWPGCRLCGGPYEGTPLAMIRVAPARPADVLALTELLEEMDVFYGAAGGASRDERMRQTAEALFSDPAAVHVLLAWDGPQL